MRLFINLNNLCVSRCIYSALVGYGVTTSKECLTHPRHTYYVLRSNRLVWDGNTRIFIIINWRFFRLYRFLCYSPILYDVMSLVKIPIQRCCIILYVF